MKNKISLLIISISIISLGMAWQFTDNDSYEFNGSNRVQVANFVNLSSSTVSLWFKVDVMPFPYVLNGKYYINEDVILSYNNGGTWAESTLKVNDNKLIWWLGKGFNNIIIPFTDTTNWHHVVLVRNKTIHKLYLDGTLLETFHNCKGELPHHYCNTGDYLSIGGESWGYNYINSFNGKVTNLSVFDRALNNTEVLELN